MAKGKTYRAFVARPSHVLGLDGELLDREAVMAGLVSEVRDISGYATFVVRNDEGLGSELARVAAAQPTTAGRRAGVAMPGFLVSGKSGRSRKEMLVQHRVVTDNPVVQFSGDYTVGVDVGINNYATVVVRDVKTGRIVYETTLSQRVHSLWNSVRASERQVRGLKVKAATLLHGRQARMAALDEAQLHREAASRKKRELAILAAQEIAYLSHAWGNAVVAVEDLGWIANTMQNGRWNRGALVQWLTHYVSQNGGWVVAVNSSHTSQKCHVCGTTVTHPTHDVSVCHEHGAMGRDVNAAANIAARAVPRVAKARVTRAKNRKLRPQAPLKTPVARKSLRYPVRDRAKSKPTPKRKNHRIVKGVILPVCPARAQAQRLVARVLADGGTPCVAGTSKAALKWACVTRDCMLL